MHKSIIRRYTKTPEIPTASTADVAFLLILFFMVTTVFRVSTLHLKFKLPEAESTERILIRRNVSHLWIDVNGKIYIDDNLVPADRVSARILPKVLDNPDLNTVLNVDENIDYGIVDVVLDQLKEAKALKITFATEFRS